MCKHTDSVGISESLLRAYLSPDNAPITRIFDEDIILYTPCEWQIGLGLVARNGWVLKSKHRSGEETKARVRKPEGSSYPFLSPQGQWGHPRRGQKWRHRHSEET